MTHKENKTDSLPRLYSAVKLFGSAEIELDDKQTHYLKNVLRKAVGDQLRVFDGQNGEWLAEIAELSKKSTALTLIQQLKTQPKPDRRIHLLFSPIKKNRMDFLIEKAVELGATDLHPVLMDHTDIGKINQDRMVAQVIEAAEQCERLSIPELHSVKKFSSILAGKWHFTETVYVCLERTEDIAPLSVQAAQSSKNDAALCIGPEGGFSESEKDTILKAPDKITPVHLGSSILRSETAAIVALSLITLTI